MAEGLGAGVWLHRCTYNQEGERDECRCLSNFLLGTAPTPSLFSLPVCGTECCLSEGRSPSSVQLLTCLEACLPGCSKSSPQDNEYSQFVSVGGKEEHTKGRASSLKEINSGSGFTC